MLVRYIDDVININNITYFDRNFYYPGDSKRYTIEFFVNKELCNRFYFRDEFYRDKCFQNIIESWKNKENFIELEEEK